MIGGFNLIKGFGMAGLDFSVYCEGMGLIVELWRLKIFIVNRNLWHLFTDCGFVHLSDWIIFW